MVDRLFVDPELAALYDTFCPWDERDDFRFYFPFVMSAASVLDVGCGTGMLLHRSRSAGHRGRLCGLDPAPGMLEQARRRDDIEWILGDLGSVHFDHELVVMTGHAFQLLVDDIEIGDALAAIRAALVPGGRFAFETRNPGAREWERWTPEHAVDATDPNGTSVRMAHQVDTPVDGDVVSFTVTYSSEQWDGPQQCRSTLRFLDVGALDSFLAHAQLVIDEQYGDWDRHPVTSTSPEIIMITRRA